MKKLTNRVEDQSAVSECKGGVVRLDNSENETHEQRGDGKNPPVRTHNIKRMLIPMMT